LETSNNTNSRTAVIKLRQCRNKTPIAQEQHSNCAGVSQFVAYVLGKFYFDFAYVLGKFYFGFAYVLGRKLVDGR